jgi:hypothetical protein
MRRCLLSLAIALTLLVTTAGRDASAKPTDLIGEDPTDRYEGGFTNLAKLITAGSYVEGIGFAIATDFKKKER